MHFTYACGDRPLEGYTIKRAIDHGGFGEVYYAMSDGGKEVALKLVRRHLEVEQRGVAQCLNLKHANLVTIYDVRHTPSGEYWIVMEFIHGKPLTELVAEYPAGLAPDEARRLFELLCEAGGYLHGKGIVHRDLKPQNMFVEDGALKVGDYGLAKFITASRRSGQTESIGTVHYMAPEVAGGSYGKEIDIYAAGVILYEMLTGRVPFDGQSPVEVLMKHLTAEPDLHILPPPYRPVVARALAKDPMRRYPSFQAMREDLAAHVSGKRVPAVHLAATVAHAELAPGTPRAARAMAAEAGVYVNSQPRSLRESLRMFPGKWALAVFLATALLTATVLPLSFWGSQMPESWSYVSIPLSIFGSAVVGCIFYLVCSALPVRPPTGAKASNPIDQRTQEP